MKKIRERIKKAVARFKKWLIRKLGGYAEPSPYIQREYVAVPIRPKKLMAEIEVSGFAEQFTTYEWMKRELMARVIDDIYEAADFKRSSYDPRDHKTKYRMILYVVDAKDFQRIH